MCGWGDTNRAVDEAIKRGQDSPPYGKIAGLKFDVTIYHQAMGVKQRAFLV
jgi:hypothetical protein